MNEKVYFIKMADNQDDSVIYQKLEQLIKEKDLFSFIQAKDMVAVKTHFGEENTKGYVWPQFFKALGNLLKAKGAQPFLTETSTLYRGKRCNAVEHIQHAYGHGFTFENTGLPIIMADGLLGDEEIEVEIPGKHYQKVAIASLFGRVQAVVMVSHFTGHVLTGFGAALKNMGMGCSSRKGKLIQHSTAQPAIKVKACTGCGECIQWCPANAISMVDDKSRIDSKKCIGCGECLAVCRFDAVVYNWGATYDDVQQKVVEHAMGVAAACKGKIMYINFLNRITKDCDCMQNQYEKIVPDVGVLVSFDPVAIDAASLDLVEQKLGGKLSKAAFNVPSRGQLDHARKLGFGNPDYELIEVGR
ncbi:MAG: DUF362 domain-containing protein [Candidatus Aminicenantes bacterium]|nr:DUF362 domain-containing protein [Candidatus Aminicenantes bacterium]